MTSLRQLLANLGPALLIDAASSRVQVGWLTSASEAIWQTSDAEAGIGVFRCLDALAVTAADAKSFIYCDGPGSILGIRTVAMAIRTWQVLQQRPVFGYCSLALVAHALGTPDATVIADARRETWHRYQAGDQLRRVPAANLCGDLVMPENFRHWSPLPSAVRVVPYSIADLLNRTAEVDLLEPTDAPDAFLHEEPSYAKWTPQIHRAPTSP